MLRKLAGFLQYCRSYLGGVKLKSIKSEKNDRLEIWLLNGKKVLHAGNANYSYANLHQVFRKVFKYIGLNRAKMSEEVLLLGLGGGSVVTILNDELHIPCRIQAVEHDEQIINVALHEFDLQRFDNLAICQSDAHDFVQHSQNKYDLVIVDLFKGLYIPEKFLQLSFIKSLLSHVRENGFLLFNILNIDEKHKKFRKELIQYLEKWHGILDEFPVFNLNAVIIWQNV